MPKKAEEIKTIMVACYKCGWSFSSDRGECPMCGADIVLKRKELIRVLGEYIERQGLWSSKKECSKFVKRFKKKNKRLPNLDELWDAAVDFAKIQLMDKKELKKLKEKQDLDLKKQMEKIKKRKLKERRKAKEAQKKETIAPEKSEKEKRLEELKRRRESVIENLQQSKGEEESIITSDASPPMKPKPKPSKENLSKKSAPAPPSQEEESSYVICPTCGTKNPPESKFCMEDGTPLE